MQAWQSSYDRGQEAYARGDLMAAEVAAQDALARARAGQGSQASYVASSLNLLGLIHQRAGRFSEAIDATRQAFEMSEQALGDHVNTAALALNLGHAYGAMRRSGDAIKAYEHALAIVDRVAVGAELETVRRGALEALARAHADLGNLEQAQSHDVRLLAEQERLPAPMRSAALARMARAQQDRGDWAAARNSLVQALALLEDPPSADPLLRLTAIEALADLLTRMQRGEEARELHERAVKLLELAEPQGLRMSYHLNELGLWSMQRGDFDVAQERFRKAVQIREALAPESIETARVLANLAQVHEANKDDVAAQRVYRQAMSLYARHGLSTEAQLGRAQALNFLAGFDYRRRRYAEAERQYLQALVITEAAEGEKSARLLPLLDNLVVLYRAQRRDSQALPYAERAARLRREQADADS
ncbi:MAG: tetratricopeptide repeat protein [Pseudorhodoferax sp.]